MWITDPAANLHDLSLIWDSATGADLSLPNVYARTLGYAPSHRWTFEESREATVSRRVPER